MISRGSSLRSEEDDAVWAPGTVRDFFFFKVRNQFFPLPRFEPRFELRQARSIVHSEQSRLTLFRSYRY